MATIKKIKLFFRIILNYFANFRVREMPKSANLGFGSLRTFCKKQVNCVQIVSKYDLCHIFATKVRTLPPVLRTHFTPMRRLPKPPLRGVLVRHVNTNRSFFNFCELSNIFFVQRLFIFKLCYRVRSYKRMI